MKQPHATSTTRLTAVVVCLLLLLFAPPLYATRTERIVDFWKPVHYALSITLDDQLKSIVNARAEIFVITLKPAVTTIDLDFGELPVDAVTVNTKPARFKHANGKLLVNLPRPVEKGTNLVVTVSYHGVPKDGLILTSDKDGKPSAVGDNWPDRVHHWIPTLDHPSAKATVSYRITVPISDVVVANGRFESVQTVSTSARTWSFVESVPIPPYCMIFAAGPFSAITPAEPTITPLSYYVPSSDAAFATKGFAPAAPSLKFFSETITPYPYEKLALIIGATQFGGMENSSAIVFPSTLFTPRPNVRVSQTFGIPNNLVDVVAHEIAHQWFGDSVTESTWSDLWLSEGFATYFAGMFIQKTDGEAAFRAYMKTAAGTYLQFEKVNKIPIHDTETQDLMKLLNANNYQKGSWVLHMLRSQLGDQAFIQGLRDYYHSHKDANASSEDLRAALEKSSRQDLRSFFASWVYGTGHPVYALTWQWNREQKFLRVRIAQTQTEDAFRNWLPLEIVTATGTKRVILKPTSKAHVEEFPLAESPTSVQLDPDDTVLKEVSNLGARR